MRMSSVACVERGGTGRAGTGGGVAGMSAHPFRRGGGGGLGAFTGA